MLTAERNRLGAAPKVVHKELQAHIRWLERRIADLDTDLDQVIRTSPVWRAEENLLRSVPGVGPIVARALPAQLHELGTLSTKTIALVSVAPLNRANGLFRGQRLVWGGRGVLQPGAAGDLRALAGRPKTTQGGPHPPYAHAPHDPERDVQASATLGPDACPDAPQDLIDTKDSRAVVYGSYTTLNEYRTVGLFTGQRGFPSLAGFEGRWKVETTGSVWLRAVCRCRTNGRAAQRRPFFMVTSVGGACRVARLPRSPVAHRDHPAIIVHVKRSV
jgi:hypothetical protein